MVVEAQNKVFDFIDSNIRESGYALINIKSKSEDNPVFTYTVGLSQKGLPELVFVRRSTQMVQHIVTDLIAMQAAGWSFTESGQKVNGILDHELCLINAQEAVQKDIMKIASDYKQHRNDEINLSNTCIVCWPDLNGSFPNDEGYDKSIKSNVIPFSSSASH
ncbi:DUF4262 domain-containing protein [Vibrio owensii]|uniref:DUF4262 domain-containing protein n=1 Tax=Vibrio harveyi group TaxID=717610 RepID=UPI003CC5C403